MGAHMSRRVLVVDDSPTIRRIVCQILEEAGYATVSAENGEVGLARLREGDVDLALIDFVMPKMNGFQFCREVRDDPDHASLPVVLMSAKGDKIRGQFVEQTGAIDAITKPFDPLALLAVVEGAFEKQQQSRAKQSAPPPSWEDEPPPSIDLKPRGLVLSDDPGLRRTQVANQFAQGLCKLIVPAIVEVSPGTPEAVLRDRIVGSVTPERLGGLASLLHVLEFGADAHVVFSGDLSFVSIAEVLQLLELQRQTGALVIATPETEIILYLREGLIDFAASRGMQPAFRLGRYLVQLGALGRGDLEHFLENRAGSKRLIGDALVTLGIVTETQVQRALVQQTSELVYEVVGWKSGRFTFTRDATCPEATLAQLGLHPGGIVMEGFRRVDEWRLIEGSFDFEDVLVRDEAAGERVLATLTDTERAVLDAIDGARTVRQIVDAAGASRFDVCKVLYQFLSSRLVRRRVS
jgi:CheY-like chemotaxis protein